MALFKYLASGRYGKLQPKGLFVWFCIRVLKPVNIMAQGSNRLPVENLDRFLRKSGSLALQSHLKLLY